MLTIKCPDCGTQMTAPPTFAGRELVCPSCLSSVVVPSTTNGASAPSTAAGAGDEPSELPELVGRDDIAAAQSDKTPLLSDDEEELDDLIDDELDADSDGDNSDGDDSDTEPSDESETFSLSRPTENSAAELAPIGGTYEIGAKHDAPMPKIEVFKALAQVKRGSASKPPKYAYFSHVFEFPWRTPAGIVPWLLTAFGLTTCSGLVALCLWVLQNAGSMGWLLISFFLLAVLVIGIWSLSYAAACATAIVQETAAGSDTVEAWPDGGVREWLFEFLPLIYIYLVSGMVGLIVALPLETVLHTLMPQMLVIQFFTFPTTYLCALDAQSFWVPFSGGVLKSIGQVPRAWLGFFGISFAFIALTFGLLYGVGYFNMWAGALLAGPLLTSVIFIYARLLGRLMWSVSVVLIQEEEARLAAAAKPKKKTRPRKKTARKTQT